MRTRTCVLLGALLLLGSSAAGALRAQESVGSAVHPEARAAIDGLWSPYCPGMMLEVCPSPGGEMLRDSIENMAARGLASDSIIEIILADYGEEYRAEPLTEGVGGLAWYIPPAAFAVGVIVVGVVLARRRGRSSFASPISEPSEEDEERLREAMSALDETERPDF